MICPRDGASLEEVKVEEIVLNRCPLCGGVWFDFALLERALSRESRALKPLMPESPLEDMPDVEYMTCPRCDDVLIHLHTAEGLTQYYGCLSCYGRWVDGDEMSRLTGRSLLRKFEKFFERLLK